MIKFRLLPLLLIFIVIFPVFGHQGNNEGIVYGKVFSSDGVAVDYATVFFKDTEYSCYTDEDGAYMLKIPAGEYEIGFSSVGFEDILVKIKICAGKRVKLDIKLARSIELDEVVVFGSGVGKLEKSAYNATAIDTRELSNTTKTLGEALAKAPGVKIRESGGVGSDMTVTMDGFSGKHVKVFIDGVPQEGGGGAFGLNNIPVNFAERIEVYRGVVPVGFGADAIGGIINIVTPRGGRKWFADASYSYGSFNTHRSYLNFGQRLSGGFKYEINAFQNYSDNDYHVDSPVEDFTTGAINKKLKERVGRFNDRYHNETVIAKAGFVERPWADRLMAGINYSRFYKEIQTGVRQEIVYGKKHRHGHGIVASLEYGKRDLFVRGLDVAANAAYNRNESTNVDTASVKYNWRGETAPLNSPGEQSYMNLCSFNDNWSGTVTFNYRMGDRHLFTVNDVFNSFRRSNSSLLTKPPSEDEFSKITRKNILGVSYRYILDGKIGFSTFMKHYSLYVSGPVALTSVQDKYERTSKDSRYTGFGVAATWFMPLGFQFKASYEKALRLPTIEEMFGDEDLELGDIGLKPESSHNVNMNLSYDRVFGGNSLYLEAGFIYRDTRDYIQRNIVSLGGGKSAAKYVNYGKVLTTGLFFSARYNLSKWLSVGGNYTCMNVRDNMKTAMGSSAENISYKERMPNLPYIFADSDINFYWGGLGRKSNVLTVTYNNRYTHRFCYYSSNLGANSDDYMVPDQFAHDVTVSYGIGDGRYTFSFECRNISDARLYDNFSLQKAGRAFYGKVRVYFASK